VLVAAGVSVGVDVFKGVYVCVPVKIGVPVRVVVEVWVLVEIGVKVEVPESVEVDVVVKVEVRTGVMGVMVQVWVAVFAGGLLEGGVVGFPFLLQAGSIKVAPKRMAAMLLRYGRMETPWNKNEENKFRRSLPLTL
jgi:hypothetical protein